MLKKIKEKLRLSHHRLNRTFATKGEKCPCPCHRGLAVMHVAACCGLHEKFAAPAKS